MLGLILIITGIILLSIFAYWVVTMNKPSPGVDCTEKSDWVWDSSCLYFQEKFRDSTLQSPQNLNLVLTGFKFASGGGPSIYLPMWYRFRYVNVLTGGYSDFSDWTQTPVISGSCCLPCIDGVGQCSSQVQSGYASCQANQPTIGIETDKAQYSPSTPISGGGFIYMNLHRYTGTDPTDNTPPPKNVTDEIVGFLKPGGYVNGKQYYDWTDVLFNPCQEKKCQTPTWCQSSTGGCGPCN